MKLTKKEMVYQILSNTKWSGVDERYINRIINVNTKKRVEEVYRFFLENPTKATFCMACLGY